MKKLIAMLVVIAATIVGVNAALAGGPPVDENGCKPSETFFQGTCHPNGESLTFCHVAGRADDPANLITLTTAIAGAVGQAGHFGENGTPNAGHEQDYLGPCVVDPPDETDVCPNLEGNQDVVPEGYVLEDGLCVIPQDPPDDPGDEDCTPRGDPLNGWGPVCPRDPGPLSGPRTSDPAVVPVTPEDPAGGELPHTL